jgi:hypothetical protein
MNIDPEAVVASLLIAGVNAGVVHWLYRKPAPKDTEQAAGEAQPTPAVVVAAAE